MKCLSFRICHFIQCATILLQVGRLQEELLEYKSGKRLTDADGVEGYNDLFHENTMLQTENNALRERIKILQETVDGLRVHNIQLLADMEVMKIRGGGGGEENAEGEGVSENEAMAAAVKKYVEEIEELRSKLLEAEATHKRSQLRLVCLLGLFVCFSFVCVCLLKSGIPTVQYNSN